MLIWPSWAHYFSKRLLRASLTVIGVVTLVFLMVRWVPGDPVDAILGDQASPEDRAELRTMLRLDRPVWEQYTAFVGDVFDGSLGMSFRQPSRSVMSLVSEVAPDTALLAFCAMCLAFGLAVPLGVFAAARRGSRWDTLASTVAVLGLAIPNLWLGPMLILLFAVQVRWLPLPGDDRAGMLGLLLPTVTLGTALMAVLTRQTRAAMVEVLGQQYVLAAQARGVGRVTVLLKHALRNALFPVMTVGAAQLGALLSGTVVTEKIFERPGLGLLFLEGFFARDIPVVQGTILIVALVVVTVNLLLDVAYVWIDPRVRLS